MPELRQEQTKTLSEGLSSLQGQAERLLGKVEDENMASQVADLLHELTALRLLVDLPQDGDRRRDPIFPSSGSTARKSIAPLRTCPLAAPISWRIGRSGRIPR